MLRAFTADYRTAGFALLERLSTLPPDAFARAVAQQQALRGGVLLATCNRFEAYLDVAGDDPGSVSGVLTAAAAEAGVSADELRAAGRELAGDGVAAHLFAVSSGLESLVVGEAEIAGQVSRALETARRAGSTTADLERVFQRASHVSGSVQTRTALGSAGRSVVRLALDLVESRVTDWADLDVLLIGTGTYAGATLAALRDRGVRHVDVTSPSDRAQRFARREGVTAVSAADLPARLAAADLVIACSVATTPILTRRQIEDARAATGGAGPRIVVDLGLPRNVDPEVACAVDDLLDLETIGLHAPLPELGATDDARALIAGALDEYRADQRATLVSPAVIAYRAHVFTLVDEEVERLRRRGGLTDAAERSLRHLASVLVHTPSARAREAARDGDGERFGEALSLVFGLNADAGTAAERAEDLPA